MDFNLKLQKYAELAIKMGVNIQPGQTLLVRSPIDCAEFTRCAVEEAYKAGAKNVYIEWSDEKSSLIKYMNAPDEAFDEFPEWTSKQYIDIAKEGGAFLSIHAQDPDLLKDVDPSKIARAQKASAQALKPWRSYTLTNKCRWNIVSVPTAPWAKKIFPDCTESEAINKLWDLIFKCSRVNDDPIKSWQEHNKKLKEKTKFLNEKKFKTIKYKSAITDLTIEMPKGHIWEGGNETDVNGIEFNPNIPTEEIFSLPHKFGVNGTLASTKPLVYGGNVIDDFVLTFKDGRIVDFSAKQGEETLRHLIETDEGSHYLGEIALVPYSSPISDTDTIFFNTLYDENASCHFAIGSAYASCIEGGNDIKEEDFDKYGVNDSLTHVDFMVGSADLDIIGITEDGEEIQIFKDGNWAI